MRAHYTHGADLCQLKIAENYANRKDWLKDQKDFLFSILIDRLNMYHITILLYCVNPLVPYYLNAIEV